MSLCTSRRRKERGFLDVQVEESTCSSLTAACQVHSNRSQCSLYLWVEPIYPMIFTIETKNTSKYFRIWRQLKDSGFWKCTCHGQSRLSNHNNIWLCPPNLIWVRIGRQNTLRALFFVKMASRPRVIAWVASLLKAYKHLQEAWIWRPLARSVNSLK